MVGEVRVTAGRRAGHGHLVAAAAGARFGTRPTRGRLVLVRGPWPVLVGCIRAAAHAPVLRHAEPSSR